MSRLHDTITRARRRHTFNRMINAAGIGTCMAVVACVVLVVIERLALSGLNLSWPVLAGIAGAGLVLGAIWPLLRIPQLAEIALQLDRALRLQDRVASAHALTAAALPEASVRTGPIYDEAFADMVRRDADRVAGIIDVRSVVPLRVGSVWAYALIAAIVLAAVYLFLPAASWASQPPLTPEQREQLAAESRQQQEQEREALVASIDQILEQVGEQAGREAGEAAADNPRVREQLEALERLSQQLQTGDVEGEDLQQLRDESAAIINELSDRLSEQSRQEQLASEKLAERFKALQTPEAPMTAEEFDEALKRGDFGRAADSLDELLRRRDELSPDERRQLAEHLQDVSRQLNEADQHDQQEIAERAAMLEQALREQGLDQQAIEQLLSDLPRTEDEAAKELMDQQIDEDVARRIARELKQLQAQRDVQEQTQEDAQAVNDALEDAARQMDESVVDEAEPDPPAEDERASELAPESAPATPGEQPEPPDQTPGDQPQDTTPPTEPSDPPGQSENQSPDEPDPQQQDSPQQQEDEQSQQQESPQSEQQQQGQSQQGQQQQERSEHQQSDQPSQDAAQQGQQQQQQQQPGQSEQRQQAEDQSGAQPDSTGEQPGQEGDQQGAAASEQPDTNTPGASEGGEESQAPGEAAGEEQTQRSPGDALREMQQRRQAAEERRRASDEMRQRAREMAEGETSQPSPQAADSPEQGQPTAIPGEGDGSGESSSTTSETPEPTQWQGEVEDVDLQQPDDDPGEVIAEWLDEAGELLPGDVQSRRYEAEQRVRRAQEVAERAVNETAVPSRYHDRIRRWFGRLDETVNRAASGAEEDNSQP